MKPIDILIQQADDILAGKGPITEDWRDALELYKAATALDSSLAYYKIGEIYLNGRFIKTDLEKALLNYKQSLRLKYSPAAASMAMVYYKMQDQENCLKLWDFYFREDDISLTPSFIYESGNYIEHTYNISKKFVLYNPIRDNSQSIFMGFTERCKSNVERLAEEREALIEKLGVQNQATTTSLRIRDEIYKTNSLMEYHVELIGYVIKVTELSYDL